MKKPRLLQWFACLSVTALMGFNASLVLADDKSPLKASADYTSHPNAKAFIAQMVAEGYDEAMLTGLIAEAKPQQRILDLMSKPAEKRLNWGEYRQIFMTPKRIERGVNFWNENQAALEKAQAEFGVPAEMIVAIIGVETHYGRIMGGFRVVDALATLGFDYPRRSEFFTKQLAEYVRMTQEEGIAPFSLKGSYAGAMGFGQFIPSSFRAYAVDFDGDGKRNLWESKTDAIGSVANYFKQHGWALNQPVVSPVSAKVEIPDEWVNQSLKPSVTLEEWRQRGVLASAPLSGDQPATLMALTRDDQVHLVFGLPNFYVITRYNRSRLYAMAVYELSQAIAEAKKGL